MRRTSRLCISRTDTKTSWICVSFNLNLTPWSILKVAPD
uniref:Uncharacterized protein n=1 Tax=Anguilla anguilla TaxID=7936 RepID=A0A0E9TA07_ANGAN